MVAKSMNSYFDLLKVNDTFSSTEEDGIRKNEELKRSKTEKEERIREIALMKTENENENEMKENEEEEEEDGKTENQEGRRRILKRQGTLANYLRENTLNDSLLGKKRMKLVENNRDYNKMNFGVKKNLKKIGKIIDASSQDVKF